jgi:hypothetical protein
MILRLALLAPHIVEVILTGGIDQRMMLEQLGRRRPAGWHEQRKSLKSKEVPQLTRAGLPLSTAAVLSPCSIRCPTSRQTGASRRACIPDARFARLEVF